MNYINKFETTEEFIQAKGELSELEHYMVYDAQADEVYVKPKPKTMKFTFNSTINEYLAYAKASFSKQKWVLIGRKDLFKSIKYNGEELLKESTVDPINWEELGVIEEKDKQKKLSEIIGLSSDWNMDYVLTIEDVLGRNVETDDEIMLEVEFKDNLTDLSAMHCALSLGLSEISSNLFKDCTKVTNFSYAFDNSSLISEGLYIIPTRSMLKSACPIDKDGTPIYMRSGSGKSGYAIVTKHEKMFNSCNNMDDYTTIPSDWGGGNIDGYKVIFNVEDNSSVSIILKERLENNEYNDVKLINGLNFFEDEPYGFQISLSGSSYYGQFDVKNIIFNNYSTSKVSNMSKMFNDCRGVEQLDLSGFDTSNVIDISYMFNNCSELTSLDLSNFNTSNVTIMDNMFNGCSKLSKIKCKQAFKDWCITNKDTINLPDTMVNGTVGAVDSGSNWEIVDYQA